MKHQFALHLDSLSEQGPLRPGSVFEVRDQDMVHRIVTILRLEPSESVIFFDRGGHAEVLLQEVTKKKVTGVVQAYTANTILRPAITVLLPVLKREAFDEALYATVELGASVVQPVFTEKTQRGWGSAKDKERAQRIMVAAAEQSKNFSLPQLGEPMDLAEAVHQLTADAPKLFFEPAERPLLELLNELRACQPKNISLLVGPEGDLTDDEKNLLKKNEFIFCALTPTVLRASQALVVGLGAVRSL